MVLPIYIYGCPVLRKKAKEISTDYKDLNILIENMFETMEKANGVGLAAPQIGLAERIFVVDGSGEAEEFPELKDFRKVFINPKITNRSGKNVSMTEGCLSLPNISESVNRPTEITVEYYDENLEHHIETYKGYAARIIQHEYDHLEGVLFIDKISPIRKRLIKSKLSSMQKGKFKIGYKFKTVS